MSYENEIVLSYAEFRRRALPVAGPQKGSVIPYDIQLRAVDEALLDGCVYDVKTNSNDVTLTFKRIIDVSDEQICGNQEG